MRFTCYLNAGHLLAEGPELLQGHLAAQIVGKRRGQVDVADFIPARAVDAIHRAHHRILAAIPVAAALDAHEVAGQTAPALLAMEQADQILHSHAVIERQILDFSTMLGVLEASGEELFERGAGGAGHVGFLVAMESIIQVIWSLARTL